MMRRTLWVLGLASALAFGTALVDTWAGPGCRGSGAAAGCGMGGGSTSMADARDTFHALLGDHEKIRRTIEEIEGGVATTTVSDDPVVTKEIRKHVRQMKGRVETGEGLRSWDPLFVEVFKHHDEIAMAIEDVPGGAKVRETSQNPDVVKLIRAHAKTVSEFAERGFERAHEASPLPADYPSPKTDPAN
jgi:uncharacterized protein